MKKDSIRLSASYGSIKYLDGAYELIFERKINHPAHKIWQALTDPEKLRLWLSPNLKTERSEIQLRLGGKVRMQFMMAVPEGIISKIEHEKLLEIDWGQEHVSRWEIQQEDGYCTLLFTERLPGPFSTDAATAWHAYTDFLEISLHGGDLPASILKEWKILSTDHKNIYQYILNEAKTSENQDAVSVTVSRKLTASPKKVFDAWVTPSRISSFMFGPSLRNETIVHLDVDARKGGKFSFAVIRDGETIDHIGEYLEFDSPTRLTFTWEIAGESDGESVVTIAFIPTGNGCTIILTHKLDPAWKDYADRTSKGWRFMLDKLKESMEKKSSIPTVTAQMLIRKPAKVVFEAFIDPEITRNFWFTKGSGKLETGKTVTWEWEMYGVSSHAKVEEIIPDKRILIQWGDPVTTVNFEFQELSEGNTYITITSTGFAQEGDELLKAINDNTGGFTTVLDGAKAYLEHNINLNLIADKFPKGK